MASSFSQEKRHGSFLVLKELPFSSGPSLGLEELKLQPLNNVTSLEVGHGAQWSSRDLAGRNKACELDFDMQMFQIHPFPVFLVEKC